MMLKDVKKALCPWCGGSGYVDFNTCNWCYEFETYMKYFHTPERILRIKSQLSIFLGFICMLDGRYIPYPLGTFNEQ